MAQGYPKTQLEFEHWFRTEEACRAYLFKIRWPEGFRCPRCNHRQAWQTGRGLWQCGNCGKDVSVTAHTIFAGSKLPLRIWFRAIWWATNQKNGVSALGLQRVMGLGSYETAWTLLHKLRRAMVRPGRNLLSGDVEVDETIIGGRRRFIKGRRPGRYLDKALVVVAAEVRGKGIGRIRLQQVSEASKERLMGFVKKAVAPGSRVITDGWWGYHGLEEKGFLHQPAVTVGQAKEALDSILPRVHRVASLLKRWLLGTHQGRVSEEHLDHYLDEFAFRFNRRTSASRGSLFCRVLEHAVAIPPVTYADVIGHD